MKRPQSEAESPPKMKTWFALCPTSELTDGQSRFFVVNDRRIALHRLGNDFFATQDECPHAGASLAMGIRDGETVSCRIHHWRFNVRTGEYLDEAKPQCNLKTFRVQVVEQRIEVEMEERPC